MNPRTNYPIPISRSLPAARQGLADIRDHDIFEFPDLGIDQMMQFTRLAIEGSLCVNTCAMDIARHLFWYPFGYWFTAANQSYAQWLDSMTQLAIICMAPRDTVAYKRAHRFEEEALGEYPETEQSVEEGFDAAVPSFDDEILA